MRDAGLASQFERVFIHESHHEDSTIGFIGDDRGQKSRRIELRHEGRALLSLGGVLIGPGNGCIPFEQTAYLPLGA